MKDRNIKKLGWFVAVACVAAGGVAQQSDRDVYGDYTKLNRKNIPSPQSMVRRGIDLLDINNSSASELKRRRKLSVYIPTLRLAADWNENEVPEFEWRDDAQVATQTGNPYPRNLGQNALVGYDNQMSYNAILTWNLSDLIFQYNETEINRAQITQASLLRRHAAEIGDCYAKVYAVIPRDEYGIIRDEDIAVLMENAAALDRYTGFFLSEVLREHEAP